MTEEERQELETLRQEKHQITQQTRAQEALQAAGVPKAFASLLVGVDDADTDRKAQQFCAAYQSALTEDIRSRLPQNPPAMTEPTASRPRKRGVHRVR